MRKILTFVAAICCTMFLSVNSVMALTPFGDGVKIEIAGVDAGAQNPLDILGDGTVAYDAVDRKEHCAANSCDESQNLSHNV